MKLVQVNFKGNSTLYTYEAPDEAQVGDTVLVDSWVGNNQPAVVVVIGSDYTGPVKRARLCPRPPEWSEEAKERFTEDWAQMLRGEKLPGGSCGLTFEEGA